MPTERTQTFEASPSKTSENTLLESRANTKFSIDLLLEKNVS